MWWSGTSGVQHGEDDSKPKQLSVEYPTNKFYDTFLLDLSNQIKNQSNSNIEDKEAWIALFHDAKSSLKRESIEKLAAFYHSDKHGLVMSVYEHVKSSKVKNFSFDHWIESQPWQETQKESEASTAEILSKPSFNLEDFQQYKKLMDQKKVKHRQIISEKYKRKKTESDKETHSVKKIMPDIDDIVQQITQKDNKIFELNNMVLELEKKIYDLQENLKEKDEVIDARTTAIALLTEDLSLKGKETFDKLDDTRDQMKLLQQNFLEKELSWTEEKNKLNSNILEKSKRLSKLEKNMKRLELARYELCIKNAELQGKLVKYQTLTLKDSPISEAEVQLMAQISDVDKELIKTKSKHIINASPINETDKVESITKNLDDLMNKIAELEEEKGHLQLKLMEVNDNSDVEHNLRCEIQELQLKYDMCASELADHIGFVSMLEKEKLELFDNNEQLQNSLQECKEQVMSVEEKLHKQSEARVCLEIKLVELEEIKDVSLMELEKRNKEIADLKVQLELEKLPVLEIEKHKLELQCTISKLQSCVDDGNEKLEASQIQLNILKKNKLEADEKLQIKDDIISEKALKLVELEKQIANLVEKQNFLTEQLEAANHMRQKMENENEVTLHTLEQELFKLRETNLSLNKQVKELHQKLDSQLSDMNKVKMELNDAECSMNQMSKNLQDDIIKKDKSLEDMHTEMESIKLEYDKLKTEKLEESSKLSLEIQARSHLENELEILRGEKCGISKQFETTCDAYSKLQEEAKLLQESVASKDVEITELLKRINLVTDELNDLNSVLSDERNLNKSLQSELENKQTEYNELESRFSETQVKYTELENKVVEGQVKLTEFESKIAEENLKCLDWQKRVNEVEAECTKLENKIADEELRGKELKARADEEQAKYTELQNKTSESHTHYETLENKLKEEQTKCIELQKLVGDGQAKCMEWQNIVAEMQIRNAELEYQATDLNTKLTDMDYKLTGEEAKCLEWDRRFAELQAKYTKLEYQLTEAQAKCAELEHKLAEERSNHIELESKVTTEQAKYIVLQDELNKEQDKYLELQIKVADEQARKETYYESTLDQLREDFSSRIAQAEQVNSNFSDLLSVDKAKDEQLNLLAIKINNLENEIETKNLLITEFKEKLAQMQTEFEESKLVDNNDQILIFIDKLADVYKNVFEMQKCIDSKDQQVIDLNKTITLMSQQYDELASLKNLQASEIQSSLDDKENLLRSISCQQEIIDNLNVEIQNYLAQINNLENSLSLQTKSYEELMTTVTEKETTWNKEIQNKNENLASFVSALKEKDEMLQQNALQINTMVENLKQWEDYSTSLSSLISEKEAQLLQSSNFSTQLIADHSLIQKQVDSLNETINFLEIEKKNLLAEVTTLKELEGKLKFAEESVEKLNEALNRKEEELQQVNAELSSCTIKLSEINAKNVNIAEKEEIIANLEQRTDSLSIELSLKEKSISQLHDDLKFKDNLLLQLQCEVDKRSEHNCLLKDYESKILEREAVIRNMKDQIEYLETLLNHKEAELEVIKSPNMSLKVTEDLLVSENPSDQIPDKLIQTDEFSDSIVGKSNLIPELQSSSALNINLQDEVDKTEILNEEINELREIIEKNRLYIQELEQTNKIKDEKVMDANTSLAKSNELNVELQSQLTSYEKIVLCNEEALKAEKKENDRLCKLLVEDKECENLSELEERFSKVNVENESLKVKLKEMEEYHVNHIRELEIINQETIQKLENEIMTFRDYSETAYNKIVMLEESLRNYDCPNCKEAVISNSIQSLNNNTLDSEFVSAPVVEIVEAQAIPTVGNFNQSSEIPQSWLDSEDWSDITDKKESVGSIENEKIAAKLSQLQKSYEKLEADYQVVKVNNGKYLQKMKMWKDKFEKLHKSGKSDLDIAIENELKDQLSLIENKLKTSESVCQTLQKEKDMLSDKINTLETANEKLVDMKEDIERSLETKIIENQNMSALILELKNVDSQLSQSYNDSKSDQKLKEVEGVPMGEPSTVIDDSHEKLLSDIVANCSTNIASLQSLDISWSFLKQELYFKNVNNIVGQLQSDFSLLCCEFIKYIENNGEYITTKLVLDFIKCIEATNLYSVCLNLLENFMSVVKEYFSVANQSSLQKTDMNEIMALLKDKEIAGENLTRVLNSDFQSQKLSHKTQSEDVLEICEVPSQDDKDLSDSISANEKLSAQKRQIEFLTEELFHLEKQNRDLQNQVENWKKHLDDFSQQTIGIYQTPRGDSDSLKLELNETLKLLHQKEIHCEDLTYELTQLLEERDTLQLKLSSSLKQYQFAIRELEKYSEGNLTDIDSRDLGAVTSDLSSKIDELQQLNYNLDVEISSESDGLSSHYPSVKNSSRDLIGANYTVSRDSQSRPRVLLNWLVGKSTPRVMHV